MAVQSLKALGLRANQAHRAAQIFRRHDRQVFKELAPLWDDDARFVVAAANHRRSWSGSWPRTSRTWTAMPRRRRGRRRPDLGLRRGDLAPRREPARA
jgi:hypothetical protein